MKTVVFGLLGTQLDMGKGIKRWERWRPTVSIFQQEDFRADRFHLIYSHRFSSLAKIVTGDIALLSPQTEIVEHLVPFDDPWDFEEVYGKLLDLTESCSFDPEQEEYLFHITTGTHVAQICIFLLAESRRFPGKLLQTSPGRGRDNQNTGCISVVDLDLSRYDRIASRFRRETKDDIAFLKSGIDTQNRAFNELIELIERVAIRSTEPILLTGATGAGKSRLARQIYALKKQRTGLAGPFVELNCATLRGDAAMSALFGHTRGAYTGAVSDRKGFLAQANRGMIFLDEIGELGPDEQAMLLHAIEEKRFFSVGSDHETESDFQIICGTNRDLIRDVQEGRFREDLLARIKLWTFNLPGLKERPEDILPNIEYELALYEENSGTRVTFNKEALEWFLDFARSPEAVWTANFRDLKAAVTRMCTLARGARINRDDAAAETDRLKASWISGTADRTAAGNLPPELREKLQALDEFDRIQLRGVLEICRRSGSMAEAGRSLFAVSRLKRGSVNDTDRLKKYLARYGLDWNTLTP
ncbi:RNA repair transcriptional activator RtcR [Breznakiella homolactica]|uniref:Sigma 54-interacting transcriptional regulator n=1 Tax=Breznakiella homolactica TaxID=2798577 RepID=A0A7T7XPU1_9SPIR|nr:RNA repair transcriptional activator RtcR [Breznakiella homolactica]QQO10257.1 RNA repair transcriptional activator RtcR [Breznakiella homolactica]